MGARTRWGRWLFTLVFVSTTSIAAANEAEKTTEKPEEKEADDASPEKKVTEPGWQPGGFPVISYDSDIGFSFGAVGALSWNAPGYEPYRLRMQAGVQFSVGVSAPSGVELSYQEDYLRIDAPSLFGGDVRIQGEVAFNKLVATPYYGLGQRTQPTIFSPQLLEENEAAYRYPFYDRMYLNVDAFLRYAAVSIEREGEDPKLELFGGLHGGYFWIDKYFGSKLSQDVMAENDGGARADSIADLLQGTTNHPLVATSLGVIWDDRDHEYVPSRGTLTEVSGRVAPGVIANLTYGRVHLQSRWFAPIYKDALVFAHRIAFDVLMGDAPVYELSQMGILQSEAFGGTSTLRGVGLRRFHGKVKLLGQAELRGSFPWFKLFEQPFRIGLVGFVDAGRVWADFESRPELDDDFDRAPFALGAGGGLRIRWGDTLIVRVDGAYSPTEHTRGIYADAGHAF